MRFDQASFVVFQVTDERIQKEVTSFLAPCLRWWRVSTVCVPAGSSAPGWAEGLLADAAVRVLLLLWSARRMLGLLLEGFWWCSGAVDRSFLPPFFSSACLVLFTPSLLEISDIGLLFSTLPMLASSLCAGDPSNIAPNWRKHKQTVKFLCSEVALANNVTS